MSIDPEYIQLRDKARQLYDAISATLDIIDDRHNFEVPKRARLELALNALKPLIEPKS